MKEPLQLLEMIDRGESSTVEFKRKTVSPEKIAKEIVAFANTKGGYLFVGVEDNGKIRGVHSEKTEVDLIETACHFYIYPTIENIQIDVILMYGREIVVAEIPESPDKPHKLVLTDKETGKSFKRAYIRVGEKSIEATSEMARLMTFQNQKKEIELKIHIGEREKRLFNYLEKYEQATVRDFCKLVNISKRRAERTLVQLVRAGVLQIHNDSTRDYFTLI
jgi:predicted HTH transcriptional regulator